MILLILLLLLTPDPIKPAIYLTHQSDAIVGNWQSGGPDPAIITIYKQEESFYGKIIALSNPLENGKPKKDNNNPDPRLRDTPILQLVILKHFRWNGDHKWQGGKIYDPANGSTYSATISLQDADTLMLRGFIGISLFGRTEKWIRINKV